MFSGTGVTCVPGSFVSSGAGVADVSGSFVSSGAGVSGGSGVSFTTGAGVFKTGLLIIGIAACVPVGGISFPFSI